MKLSEVLATEWKRCSGCNELGFIVKIEGNTLCYDCLGIGFASYPRGYRKNQIPEDIRGAVFERDNHTCKNCGSITSLQVDHIFPERLGGDMSMDNLQTLCKSCNGKKGIRI